MEIDPLSGKPATPSCPKHRPEVYVAGTQPVGLCPLHGGRTGITSVSGWDAPATAAPRAARATPKKDEKTTPKKEDKNSLFRRLNGVFK